MMESIAVLDERSFEASLPEVRRDALVRHYGDEAIAWSPVGREPIHLDPVAVLIFPFLDGATTMGELVADVHEVVGVPAAVARNRLRDIVTALDRAALLATSPIPDEQHDRSPFSGPLNH